MSVCESRSSWQPNPRVEHPVPPRNTRGVEPAATNRTAPAAGKLAEKIKSNDSHAHAHAIFIQPAKDSDIDCMLKAHIDGNDMPMARNITSFKRPVVAPLNLAMLASMPHTPSATYIPHTPSATGNNNAEESESEFTRTSILAGSIDEARLEQMEHKLCEINAWIGGQEAAAMRQKESHEGLDRKIMGLHIWSVQDQNQTQTQMWKSR
jgi:hypothetical protein